MQNTNENNSSASDLQTNKLNTPGMFDKPRNVSIVLNTFYVICVLLVVLDFVVHRHIYVYFEELPAFYAVYGFVACVVLVVLAKLMRLFLMKDENFYDLRLDEADTTQYSENHTAQQEQSGESK